MNQNFTKNLKRIKMEHENEMFGNRTKTCLNSNRLFRKTYV